MGQNQTLLAETTPITDANKVTMRGIYPGRSREIDTLSDVQSHVLESAPSTFKTGSIETGSPAGNRDFHRLQHIMWILHETGISRSPIPIRIGEHVEGCQNSRIVASDRAVLEISGNRRVVVVPADRKQLLKAPFDE